jgi:hypothetical protein
MSKLQHCLDNWLTDDSEVVSLMRWLPFIPRATVLLEGLGKLKKSNDFIGNQTRDLPPCTTVPQPTMLPCAPIYLGRKFKKA